MVSNRIKLKEKWIISEDAILQEKVNKDGKTEHYLNAQIVPFDEISRNKVKYNSESIKKTHQQLVGKYLNHNHVTEGGNTFPRGEWVSTGINNEGMVGIARIYDTDYNKDYVDFLKAAKNIKVSLQVTGEAAQKKNEETGELYTEAMITDWHEASTVVVPGFNTAKANFEIALAESFSSAKGINLIKPVKMETFYDKLLESRNEFKELGEEKTLMKYRNINVQETNNGYAISCYATEQEFVAETEEELFKRISECLNSEITKKTY